MSKSTVGRPLCSEEEAFNRGFLGWLCKRRREVLHETINAFMKPERLQHYHELAESNLYNWKAQSIAIEEGPKVEVFPEDWGDVTKRLTSKYGSCFAVLNMASAYVPGGAYVEGAAAQEESMFRRTDCHFRITKDEYDFLRDRYHEWMTELLSAKNGEVFLDVDNPRVCIRGSENRQIRDLGYPWLSEKEVFPFYELRAAAKDLRRGIPFDPHDARRRIAAQLDTLIDKGIRNVVLGAFGCGAFRNPAGEIAAIYHHEIRERNEAFDHIAFAILQAGYGPDNFTPFKEEFKQPE